MEARGGEEVRSRLAYFKLIFALGKGDFLDRHVHIPRTSADAHRACSDQISTLRWLRSWEERTVTAHDFMIVFQQRRYISLVSDEAAVTVGMISLVIVWVEGGLQEGVPHV